MNLRHGQSIILLDSWSRVPFTAIKLGILGVCFATSLEEKGMLESWKNYKIIQVYPTILSQQTFPSKYKQMEGI